MIADSRSSPTTRAARGRELAANPHAALAFYWHDLERQVRIEGRVERVSPEESDAYFQGRPAGFAARRLGLAQSEVIAGREVLEAECLELEHRYPDGQIPRPDFWGGFRVVPESVEFWLGRPSRLHDRLRYTRHSEGWRIDRLSP